MPFLVRHRQLVSIATHLGIAAFAYLVAFGLRFDLELDPHWVATALATLPLLLACKLVGFWSARLFGGSWRHVSVQDVEDIARGNVLASTLFLAVMVFTHGLRGFPRSVFLLDLVLCTLAMSAIRVGIRLAHERRESTRPRRIETLAIIVGAGSAGIKLLQEIEQRRRLRVGVVGFVDDDPRKIGLRVCGTPVLGRLDDLPELLSEHEVGEVLIALPEAPGAVIRRVVQHCTAARVRHRVLPTLAELVDGRVMYTQMREVKVGDLLARDPVRLDLPRVAALVGGKTVLVTGAAGSIGSELCRQVAAYGPSRLVLYDRHENGMFVLEMELKTRFPDVTLVPVLGYVLLVDQLERVFAAEKPDLVMLGTSGYGHRGPHRGYVTWGSNIEALSGLATLSGFAHRPCTITQYAYPDVLSALHGLVAVLGALAHRDRTGAGQYIDVAQVEATIAAIGDVMLDVAPNAAAPARIGNRSPAATPHGCYPSRGDDR